MKIILINTIYLKHHFNLETISKVINEVCFLFQEVIKAMCVL